MRSPRRLRPVAVACLAAAALGACAFGETPSTPLTAYDLEFAQLRLGCAGRHGVLVNSGRITGQARTETLCLIVAPAAPAETVTAAPKRKAPAGPLLAKVPAAPAAPPAAGPPGEDLADAAP